MLLMDDDQFESEGLLEKIEISLLLEGIYRHYGYDFRNYSYQSIRRRIRNRLSAERLGTISALQDKVLHDRSIMDRLFADFSINVTEMFRDPSFFISFKENVIPRLQDLPMLRIWHAGCSSGEEVYSMAIVLHEAGLYDRSMIYATDMNAEVLNRASSGIFPLDKMQIYTKNYIQSGGRKAFSEYYKVVGSKVVFHPFLAENLFFSQHNLVTDHSFNEFHIIICRNVLIYFDDILQERTFHLFRESLITSGYLGLGSKEGIPYKLRSGFNEVDSQNKIFSKK